MTEVDGGAALIGDQQRAYFDAFGFLVLPGLFRAEVEALRGAFDALYADETVPRLDWNVVGHRWNSQIIMSGIVERHPTLDALRSDRRILDIVTGLLGPTATYDNSDGSIFCCETEWHYDSPMVATDCRHLKVAFYLDPGRAEAGALRVLPSSHHDVDRYRDVLEPYLGFDGMIHERTGTRGEDLPHWTLPTEPGDVLVWDFGLMHASYGCTDPRRQFTLNFHGPPLLADRS